MIIERRKFNDNQKSRIDNEGTLLASGLIAGEALMGLVFAALAFFDAPIPNLWPGSPFLISALVMVALGFLLVKLPVGKAGKPEDPAVNMNV
jgi:hypothetical protein